MEQTSVLSRPNRLRQTRDINRVYGKGKFGGGGPLYVKALQKAAPSSRAVIVVSKKVSKKAVVRNRIRRRISGWLEDQWKTLPGGYDIVITVVNDISEMPPLELEKALVKALKRSGVQ